MSFDIALSGIQSINQQLNSTSNNIANAGTYGFKSSRANFSAMYAGSRATGTEIGSITQSMSLNGGVLNTGRALDAAIDGRGYFVARDAQNTMSYSRVGIFSASNDGKLIDSNGRLVQGYAAVKGSTTLGTLGDMNIPTGQIPAVASTKLAYAANMSSEWPIKAVPFDKTNELSYNSAKSSIVYDSLGAKHSLGQYFVKTAAGVDVYCTLDNVDVKLPLAPVASMTFDTSGKLTMTAPVTLALGTPTGAAPLSIAIDYTGTTQFAGESTTSTDRADGYASGTYTGVELADDGSVVAKYTNGQKQSIGVIALATFPDEGALTAVNDTSWVASTTSGTAIYDRPGVGMAGKLVTSSLEQSNVDITSELVGLMTSQRNYQANSKVISTENAMLQSLMQAL
ncbi:flagellar hook-basal body complex protein [Janthinobacterium sp. HSC-3S05]|uniref:flagellar hook protein FlgE n=1 Tax=Janthinobacterium lividum TaxID=29581 RepID=UPI001CD88884|nr:flagellar hook-basal body complex protein [Janthinobacterium lividum]MCA1859018.1 flagellar hook-basal body complex protein [Janthinobacterium lividum]